MAKVIKIQLLQALILNSVKNETYLRSRVDKATDEKLLVAAYHESAGDEEYQERMLRRAMFSQAEKLKTWFSDYLTGDGNTADDALVSSEEKDGSIDILLRVSDRFIMGYVKTLARLSQKYVEDRMIHLWWASLDEKKSQFYAQLAVEDLQGLQRCFSKSAPSAPSYCFPDSIQLVFPIIVNMGLSLSHVEEVPASTMMQYPYILAVGDETELTYILASESGQAPTDDILVRVDDAICAPAIDPQGHWLLKALKPGITIVTLFSRHNDQVFASFALRVIPA